MYHTQGLAQAQPGSANLPAFPHRPRLHPPLARFQPSKLARFHAFIINLSRPTSLILSLLSNWTWLANVRWLAFTCSPAILARAISQANRRLSILPVGRPAPPFCRRAHKLSITSPSLSPRRSSYLTQTLGRPQALARANGQTSSTSSSSSSSCTANEFDVSDDTVVSRRWWSRILTLQKGPTVSPISQAKKSHSEIDPNS